MEKKTIGGDAEAAGSGKCRSLPIASAGVRTGDDFTRFMSALMTDVIEGNITPMVANAACSAGAKLLKAVELQYKYGQTAPTGEKKLDLCGQAAGEAKDQGSRLLHLRGQIDAELAKLNGHAAK